MARANDTTEPGVERNSGSFMPSTIADAICDSNCDFINCYRAPIINPMDDEKDDDTAGPISKLRALVDAAGGPLKFATQYTQDPDNAINQTYVSQLLNGKRKFREVARRNMAKRAGLPLDYFEDKRYIDATMVATLPPALGDKTPWGNLSRDEIELVTGYREATPEIQVSMMDMARRAIKTGATGTNSPLPQD